MKSLTKIVYGVLIFFVAFVAAMIIIFLKMGSVPDTLIQYTLGGTGVELISTALIQIFKRKYGGNDPEPPIDGQ